MILIADGGSTKASWCTIDKNKEITSFETEGYNPYFVSEETITKSLNNSLPQNFIIADITQVTFYGAGCSTQIKNKIVHNALKNVFSNAKISVEHDLLAAARALLGTQQGLAAILGTGTNSCLYDGKNITLNIDSLGYLLGDEGSGSFIGKQVLRDYIRGYMPDILRRHFNETFKISHEDILASVYNKPLPNRFCASFTRFLYDNQEYCPEYTHKIIFHSFDILFRDLITHYPNYQKYHFNCVGSVALNFKPILAEVAQQYHMELGKIIAQPIHDLVKYHLNNL